MNNHILETIPGNVNTNINSDPWEFRRMREIDDRRLYLYGEIVSVSGDCFDYADSSIASMLVEEILNINRLDSILHPLHQFRICNPLQPQDADIGKCPLSHLGLI